MEEIVSDFADKSVENVVPLYCQEYNRDLRGTLVPMAAEVVLLTRMGGTRKVAKFFSDFLGKKISRKPIETILNKVRSGELIVTEEQIRRAASRHPMAQRFVEKAPWILDPKSEATIVPEEPKVAKKAGRKKAGSEETAVKASVGSGTLSGGFIAPQKTITPPPPFADDPAKQEALERLKKIKADRLGKNT